MPTEEMDPEHGSHRDDDATGSSEMSASGTRRSGPRLPRPSRARFPGWLLPLLGGAVGGFVAGWWGAAFGAVVGFLVWRTRA